MSTQKSETLQCTFAGNATGGKACPAMGQHHVKGNGVTGQTYSIQTSTCLGEGAACMPGPATSNECAITL
jgi:hypothetical protein